MDLHSGVARAGAGEDVPARDAFIELAAENARLQRLVGELLLKNQRLREAAMVDEAGFEA